MEVKNITKAATFKTFLHLSYENTQLLFLWTVRFNFFMIQTLIDDFLGLHKNMNYAFPLMLFLKSIDIFASVSVANFEHCFFWLSTL